jgi:hypothetical protein
MEDINIGNERLGAYYTNVVPACVGLGVIITLVASDKTIQTG